MKISEPYTAREFPSALILPSYVSESVFKICTIKTLRMQDLSRREILSISVYYAAIQGSFTTEDGHLSQKSFSKISVPEYKQP